MTSFYLIIAIQILYSRHVCSPLAMILKQTQSGPWKQNCQIDNRPTRRWYSGELSCLPSTWPGFDSRPTQCCLCLIFCFLLRLLLSVTEKPVTWRDRASTTRSQRTNNKTNMSNKQDAINFIYSWKLECSNACVSKQPIPCERKETWNVLNGHAWCFSVEI